MEGNFRLALIILSAVIIGAIFIHGLWTIRKNKNPYKMKAKNEPVEPIDRGFDQAGFDQDGVSVARVVKPKEVKEEITEEIKQTSQEAPSEESELPSFTANENDLTDELEHLAEIEQQSIDSGLSEVSEREDVITSEPTPELFSIDEQQEVQTVDTPVYEEPVIQAKPTVKKPERRKPTPRNSEKAALKRNQMEINFGDELLMGDSDKMVVEPSPQPEPEVIVISVVMPENQVMQGAALLPCLLTLGMKFGEMEIFHRHQDNAGNGKVTFSLANMMNPGTFNLDSMENFATQGVTLFMTLPNEGDAFEVFEQMLSSAKHLAQEFNGQLLDDKRSVLTKQTEQHYVSKIREFERRNRIAAF